VEPADSAPRPDTSAMRPRHAHPSRSAQSRYRWCARRTKSRRRTPTCFNILLQVLDEGHSRITTARDRFQEHRRDHDVENVGARDVVKGKTLGFWQAGREERLRAACSEKVKEEVNKVFNPEFLNRLDDVIVFPLAEPASHRAQCGDPGARRAEAPGRGRAPLRSRRRGPTSWSNTATTSTSARDPSSAPFRNTTRTRFGEDLVGDFAKAVDEIEVGRRPRQERLGHSGHSSGSKALIRRLQSPFLLSCRPPGPAPSLCAATGRRGGGGAAQTSRPGLDPPSR